MLCFATQGAGHGDEDRIHALLEEVRAETFPFDRANKARTSLRLLRTVLTDRPDLVVMEGTGLAGGLAMIGVRLLAGIPYVVSSGDAVGPYISKARPSAGPLGAIYERLLCRLSAGYIGWSPYLAGRALTFGAPRAMTAAGWSTPARPEDRDRRRNELKIPDDAIVFGIVGSLDWNPRIDYCYGKELVEAVCRTGRDDLRALIIGDGSGFDQLRALAGKEVGRRVLLPGRIPKEEVTSYLAAMDVASLPQSVDRVGSFRYTTKISEYLAATLPVATGRIPAAYDLDAGWIWRLGGDSPWDPRYVSALACLMGRVNRHQVEEKRRAVPSVTSTFDVERQRQRVTAFVREIIDDRSEGRHT